VKSNLRRKDEGDVKSSLRRKIMWHIVARVSYSVYYSINGR
jgi:hypothetical protein